MGKSVTGIRLAAAALLFAPLLAYAAGLGRLTVQSVLGQPLSAEIELVAVQPGEEDSLSARLAAPDAFRQAAIELSPALVGLQFSIERREGRHFIRVRSAQAMNEPFLDLLVELQWATGRLVREYTLLLDPVEYKAPAAAAAASQPVPAPAQAPSAAAAPAPTVAAPRTESRPESRPITAPAPTKSTATHEVKKGDTLGAIARSNKLEGVTLNQMLIALYRANQAAFIRGNINLVRAGRILNIPDREAANAIDPADANRLVSSQMTEFAEYRRKLAGAVASAPASAAPPAREVTGKIAPKPEAPAAAEPKDQLRLSKADPAKPGAPAAKAAEADDRVARDRSLKESQSRIGALEKNVTDLQKLVEMKNQQLAELEKKAGAKPAPAAPAPKPEPAKPEPAKPAPAAAKPAPEAAKPAPEPAKPAVEAPKAAEPAKAAEAPKPAAKPAPDAPKAKAAAKAAPAKAPEADLMDEVTNFLTDPVSGGGLAAVLLLLVGYGAWAWRKKKAAQGGQQSSRFQDSVLGAASGGGAGSVFGAAPGATPAAAAAAPPPPPPSAAVAPVEELPSGDAPASDEVDPIAEADVYMAYGRNAQAEEILKEAIAKDDSRVAVHAKLLEIYANKKDTKAFEQSALKVKSLTNGSGPEWNKAMTLGHSIDPANGLYGSGGTAEAAAAETPGAAPALDFDIGGGGGETAAAEPSKADSTAPLDFDLGGGAPSGGEKSDFAAGGTLVLDAGEANASSSGLDFDLDKTQVGTAPPQAPAAKSSGDPDATVAMDFDLNLDLGGDKTAVPASGGLDMDLGSISLDLGGPGAAPPAAGGDAKWQEIATKLDLAKAYEEMGDKDGARELLNEVVRDGDAAQQAQAQQMLGNLG